MSSDPRVTPARPDLAARHLRGIVEAERYADGVTEVVLDAVAPVRRAPMHDAPLDTEALMGERVTVYETTEEGWCWGQLEADGYVGWLPANALGRPGGAPTHKVSVLRTFVFPGPSIKIPPVASPPFGARLTIARTQPPFAVTENNGFVPDRHVAPLGTVERDWVSVAERFIGTPYLWGGKSAAGIDCSGLVQTVLAACGIVCPRDSDMQQRDVGEAVALADVRRGDLVSWKGHVALACDAQTLIHANAFHMAVAVEPLAEALARISAAGSEVAAVKRVG